MLGPEQAYEGLYGQGPPSVHSSHGGRAFQQGMYTFYKQFLTVQQQKEQHVD